MARGRRPRSRAKRPHSPSRESSSAALCAWSKPISIAASPPSFSRRGSCGASTRTASRPSSPANKAVCVRLGEAGSELALGRDVGRVAQNEVEAFGHAFAQLPCEDRHVGHPRRCELRWATASAAGTNCRAEASGLPHSTERGRRAAARAGAEVENARGPACPRNGRPRRRAKFAVGPRNEHVGSDVEFKRPKRPLPDDVGDRVTAARPREQLPNSGVSQRAPCNSNCSRSMPSECATTAPHRAAAYPKFPRAVSPHRRRFHASSRPARRSASFRRSTLR